MDLFFHELDLLSLSSPRPEFSMDRVLNGLNFSKAWVLLNWIIHVLISPWFNPSLDWRPSWARIIPYRFFHGTSVAWTKVSMEVIPHTLELFMDWFLHGLGSVLPESSLAWGPHRPKYSMTDFYLDWVLLGLLSPGLFSVWPEFSMAWELHGLRFPFPDFCMDWVLHDLSSPLLDICIVWCLHIWILNGLSYAWTNYCMHSVLHWTEGSHGHEFSMMDFFMELVLGLWLPGNEIHMHLSSPRTDFAVDWVQTGLGFTWIDVTMDPNSPYLISTWSEV